MEYTQEMQVERSTADKEIIKKIKEAWTERIASIAIAVIVIAVMCVVSNILIGLLLVYKWS